MKDKKESEAVCVSLWFVLDSNSLVSVKWRCIWLKIAEMVMQSMKKCSPYPTRYIPAA